MVNTMALIKLLIAIELIVPLVVIGLIVSLRTQRITRRLFGVLVAISLLVFTYSSISIISYMSGNTCHDGPIQENHKLFNVRSLFCD